MTSDRRLILMCGMSFSGKTTLARSLSMRTNAPIVSLDDINAERGLHGGLGMTGEQWAGTHMIAQSRARAHLRIARVVIVDDTSSLRFLRENWRRIAEEFGATMSILWVDVDERLQRARLEANRRTHARQDITDTVMTEHRETFEPPRDEGAVRVDAALAQSDRTIDAAMRALGLSATGRDEDESGIDLGNGRQ